MSQLSDNYNLFTLIARRRERERERERKKERERVIITCVPRHLKMTSVCKIWWGSTSSLMQKLFVDTMNNTESYIPHTCHLIPDMMDFKRIYTPPIVYEQGIRRKFKE